MSVKPKSSSKPWTDPDDAPELTEADMRLGNWQVGGAAVSAKEGKAFAKAALRAAELLAAHAPVEPSTDAGI